MKKILLALATVAMVFAGCNKGLEDRLTKLENRVSDIEAFVTNLNAEVEGLQIIVSNLQKNVYVTGYADIKNTSGAVIGYEITFNEGNPIKIYHGNTGETGAKGDAGATPTIDYYDENPDDEVDGEWYWKSGDDWIRDVDNNMIPVYKNVEFSVVEGVLFVAVGNADPISLGSIKGEQGDSMFEGVTVDEQKGTVTINLKGTDKDLVLPLNAIVFNIEVPASFSEVEGAPVEIAYEVSGPYAANTVVLAYPTDGLKAVVDKVNSKVKVTIGSVDGRVDIYALALADDGEIVKSYLKQVCFNAGAKLATTVTEAKLYFSPDGTGSVEIPVATAQNYTVDITSCPWLEYSISQTKAYREETITFTAKGENTSGTKNEGTIVLKGEDGEELFSVEVSQPDYVKELLGEYIESYTMSYATHAGTLVIELSDDFSKGVYKTTICGAEMYADYRLATEENKPNEYVLYYQTKSSKYEYPLKVSDDFNRFSSDGFGIPGAYGSVTVSNYLAVAPLGPAQLTEAEQALVGVYNETWTHKSATPSTNAMVIAASEEAAYGQLKVKLLVTSDGSAYEGYASLKDDKLIVPIGGQTHNVFGKIWNPDEQLELTVNADGTLTMSDWTDGNNKDLSNYCASKYVEGGDEGEDEGEDEGDSAGVTLADLIGTTWSEAFTDFSGTHSGVMTISETDNTSKGQIKVRMLAYGEFTPYYVECYADLDTTGKTLTVKTNGVDYIGWGVKCGGDIVLEISEAGTKMTMTNIISLHYGNLESYIAIKN